MANKANEDPAWLVTQWSNWLSKALTAHPLSNQKVAEAAGFNPSYISLMLKGTIPRRHQVASLGRVLGKEAEALLMAGYVPHRGFIKALTAAMRHKATEARLSQAGYVSKSKS